MDVILVGFFSIVFLAIALYAIRVRQGGWRWWALAAIMTLLVVGSRLSESAWPRLLLLEASAFTAVGLVWVTGTPAASRAAWLYLWLLIPAVGCSLVGFALADSGTAPPDFPIARIAAGLLVVGFGLKLALIPFYFWLPEVAEHAPPMTSALIISVVDIAAFTELVQLRVASPWIFTDYGIVWMVIALASMFGGALLALAQKDIKRMLAFSTIDDMGYLLLGVVAGGAVGLSGAWLGALSHSLFKLILFGAVGVAEKGMGKPVTLTTRGLAARYPAAAAAFIAGALGIIGVPPAFGFVGRWRLYLAGAQYGGVLLVVAMAVATGLALLYFVRAIHATWLGPADVAEAVAPRYGLASVVLIVLVLVAVLLGFFPAVFTRLNASLAAMAG